MWNLRWCRRSVRRSNNKELQLGDILESTMKWTHWTYLYTSWWHLMRYCRRRNTVLTTTATFYTPQHHPRLVLSRQRSKRSILFKQNPGINQWRGSRHISYIWYSKNMKLVFGTRRNVIYLISGYSKNMKLVFGTRHPFDGSVKTTSCHYLTNNSNKWRPVLRY
jgi:hypothetical protein